MEIYRREDDILAIGYMGFILSFFKVSMEEETDWKLMLFGKDQNTSPVRTEESASFVWNIAEKKIFVANNNSAAAICKDKRIFPSF